MCIRDSYTAVCGQLKELQVVENEYVAQGDVLGYVAEPTKYYSIEGANLYLDVYKRQAASVTVTVCSSRRLKTDIRWKFRMTG